MAEYGHTPTGRPSPLAPCAPAATFGTGFSGPEAEPGIRSFPQWDEIVADLDEMRRSPRIASFTRSMADVDTEDLRQITLLKLVLALARRPGLRNVFTERKNRRAYLAVCLLNCARAAGRRARSRREIQGDEAPGPPDDSARAVHERSIVEQFDEIIERVEEGSHAALAMHAILGVVTLDEYALEKNVTKRTAYRHFLLGREQLRNLADRG